MQWKYPEGRKLASLDDMKDPRKPDTQADQYLPDLPSAHRTPPINPNPEGDGVNPMDTSSMPRGEDDDQTRRDSPEFHDRPVKE
jgi:hypothetical protein